MNDREIQAGKKAYFGCSFARNEEIEKPVDFDDDDSASNRRAAMFRSESLTIETLRPTMGFEHPS